MHKPASAPGHASRLARRSKAPLAFEKGEIQTREVELEDVDNAASRKGWIARTVAMARAKPGVVDLCLGASLFGLAMYASRDVILQFEKSEKLNEIVRRNAQAAVKLGGADRDGALKVLDELARITPKPSVVLLYLLAAVCTLPLVVRRRFAGPTHLLVLFGFVATYWFVPANATIALTSVWVTTYSSAAYDRWSLRIRNAVLVVSVALVFTFASGIVVNSRLDKTEYSIRDKIAAFASVLLLYGSSIALGLLLRRYRSTVEVLQRQAIALTEQRDELSRTAGLNERVRIARDLHDVVAHHVSVIGLHAGAARMALREDDTEVRESLQTIENASRDVVTDLYRSINLLRGSSDNREVLNQPAPNAQQLDTLFSYHEAAGFALTKRISTDLANVSPAVSLTVYRIVQEALTNIRKHGDTTDNTIVEISQTGARVGVRVANVPLSPRATFPMPKALGGATVGLGLQGMRERAALHDGELTAIARHDGGFTVDATLNTRG